MSISDFAGSGYVATAPKRPEGEDRAEFTLAQPQNRRRRPQRLTVVCTGALAANVMSSIEQGDSVIVIGRLETDDQKPYLAAFGIGHDLRFGTSDYRRPASA